MRRNKKRYAIELFALHYLSPFVTMIDLYWVEIKLKPKGARWRT